MATANAQVRKTQEARRSNACAPRRNLKKYSRTVKHRDRAPQ